MKKFNRYEKWLLETGLVLLTAKMKKEIAEAEEQGKNPIMTQGYVDMVAKETLDKLTELTLKNKL